MIGVRSYLRPVIDICREFSGTQGPKGDGEREMGRLRVKEPL